MKTRRREQRTNKGPTLALPGRRNSDSKHAGGPRRGNEETTNGTCDDEDSVTSRRDLATVGSNVRTGLDAAIIG